VKRIRYARYSLAFALAMACTPPKPGHPLWSERAVASLGADDGYLFVFSPFNCSLRAPQIRAMNELARRHRRSGRILTIGHALSDSTTAAQAVAELGILLQSRPLATTALGGSPVAGLIGPLAIAIRHGKVIAILAGANAERIDTWLAWLEQTEMSATHGPSLGG
jgi:hypothetical protein